MSDVILPRSPYEKMDGWVHLPRFVDKIRLHLAGKLPADYQENFTKGFDGMWLDAAGVSAAQFIDVVKGTITDGEVCDWVRVQVKKSESEKSAFNEMIARRGADCEERKQRLELRKQQCGLAHRTDVTTFFDFIDADERRK